MAIRDILCLSRERRRESRDAGRGVEHASEVLRSLPSAAVLVLTFLWAGLLWDALPLARGDEYAAAGVRIAAAQLRVAQTGHSYLPIALRHMPFHDGELLAQLGGSSLDLVAVDDIVYLAVGPRVVALDVSDPRQPRPLGASDVLSGSGIRRLEASGGHIYVVTAGASRGAGDSLEVLDIRSADVPQRFARLGGLPYGTHSLAITSDAAVVASDDVLTVIDVGDPGRLRVRQHLEDRISDLVAAGGDHVYYVRPNGRVAELLDLSVAGSATARLLSGPSVSGSDPKLAYAEGHVYVADGYLLRVLDVADPTRPRQVATLDGINGAGTVQARGGFVALADKVRCPSEWQVPVEIIDVRKPSWPRSLGLLATKGDPRAVFVDGHNVYVATTTCLSDGRAGLRIGALDDPFAPRPIGEWETIGFATGAAASGNRAYVLVGTSGLHVVDLHDPADPRSLGFWTTPIVPYIGPAQKPSIAAFGDIVLLAAATEGLLVVDASAPHAPRELARVALPPPPDSSAGVQGTAMAVVEDRGYAFVARGASFSAGGGFVSGAGLTIIDLADRRAPQVVADVPLPGTLEPRALAVEGDVAYVATISEAEMGTVWSIDVRSPRAPIRLASIKLPGDGGPWSIQPFGGYVAVASDSPPSIHVLDLAEPAHPSLSGSARLAGGWRIVDMIADEAGIIALETNGDGEAALARVDLTASAPRLSTRVPIGLHGPAALTHVGDLAVVVTWGSGIGLTRIPADVR